MSGVLGAYRTIKEPTTRTGRDAVAGLSRAYARDAPGPMAHSQRRMEALRLLQGLVVAYENLSRDQRRRAVLRDRSFLPALAALLAVRTAAPNGCRAFMASLFNLWCFSFSWAVLFCQMASDCNKWHNAVHDSGFPKNHTGFIARAQRY